MARELWELQNLQALPLDLKVKKTQQRIREWVDHYGEDGVYVSFSGGKDSTVLLHIVREMYPNIPAVFFDTGLEYPEIRKFVKTFDNVEWARPGVTFRDVIEKYGYPFISKQVSKRVYEINNARKKGKDITQTSAYKEFTGQYKMPDGNSSFYDKSKWGFLMESPYKMSNVCCDIMKKNIAHDYRKRTGRVPIVAQLASESIIRQEVWLKNGCNAFESKDPKSSPMSFWKEMDVLAYIKINELPICPIYGDIVEKNEINGQLVVGECLNIDGSIQLETTGERRTGCMFCGYGCHLEKPGEGRFERMKLTHPKQYEYIMKPWDEGGLGYKDVIDWINEHGGTNIRY